MNIIFLFQEIEKKYPGFIHSKLLQGIRLSFRVQQITQSGIVRGYRVVKEGELPTAMNGYLYSIMKNTKTQRRAILMSLLKQFDESSVRSLKIKIPYSRKLKPRGHCFIFTLKYR